MYTKPNISVFLLELDSVYASSPYGDKGFAGEMFNEVNTHDYDEL